MIEGNIFSTLIDIVMAFNDKYTDTDTFFKDNQLHMFRGYVENLKTNMINFILSDIKSDSICIKDVSQNEAVGFLIISGTAAPGIKEDDYKFMEELVYDDVKTIHLFVLVHPMSVDDDTSYTFEENDKESYNFESPTKKDIRSIWMLDIIDRCISYYVNTVYLSRHKMVSLTNNSLYTENTMLVLFKALAIRLSIYGKYIFPNYIGADESFKETEAMFKYDALILDRINLDWLKLSDFNNEKKVEIFSNQIALKTELYKWIDEVYKSITFIRTIDRPYLNNVYNKLIQLFVYGKVYDTIKPYHELCNFLVVGPILYSTHMLNKRWKEYLEGETS